MAETYSAGTIFLQVVPVFRHAQEKVTAYAKGISKSLGDELDKGGQDAGERFNEGFEKEVKKGAGKAAATHATEFQRQYDRAIGDMQKNLRTIEPKFENNEARRQIRELKAELDTLTGKKIRTDADVKEAVANIRILEAQLGGLPEVVSTKARFEATQAYKDAAKFVSFVEAIDGKDIEIEVRVDTKDLTRAERAMGVFEKKLRESARRAADNLGDPIDRRVKQIKSELEGLSRTDIHIGLNDDVASAKLDKLMAELEEISANDVNIGMKVDTGRAFAELYAFKKLRDRLDGNTIHENVDVNTSGAEAKLAALTGNANGGANAFRAFNLVILAAVAILPVLIPMVGALGGALLAMMPIVAGLAGGLAAVVIGFTGIANAVQALNARSQAAAKDTLQETKTIRDAWYGVVDARQAVADAERTYAQQAADAARAVADARRQAAEAVRSALEQQQQAQESYAQSVNDVRDAEQALRDARAQAKKDQQSLKDQVKDNRLAIRQGVLNAFDATNNLNAVMADGSSTTYDKEQAKIQRAQALQSLHELREQQKQLLAQQKQGVKGSDAVKNAQDQLTQAIQAQHDALTRLGDAARAVDQARANGARQVADALRNQNRTDADGKRNVARAAEALRRAQENYNDSLKKTDVYGSAAQDQVRQAMAVLGPAGREFARFIFGLRKGFYALRNDIQAVMLPPIERAIKRIIRVYGPGMHDFLVNMAREFGRFVTRFARSLESPAWRGFFIMLDRLGPRFMRQFGKGVILWLETFARLMTITAPWAVKLSDGLLGIARAVNRWIMSKAGTEIIQRFMDYAFRVGPKVLDFLFAFVDAALNLADALGPWAESVLAVLTGFLNIIADMNPTVLGLIATGILSLVIAFQLAVGAVAAVAGIIALTASEVGVLVFVVVLVIALALTLIARFKFLQKAIGAVLHVIGDLIGVLVDAAKWLGRLIAKGAEWIAHNRRVQQVVGAVWGFLKNTAEDVFDAISTALGWIADRAQDVWGFLLPIFSAIGKLIKWLWTHAFKPYIGFIVGAFRTLGRIFRAVWNGFLFPIFDLWIHIYIALWKKGAVPAMQGIAHLTAWLGREIAKAWHEKIQPIFSAFGDLISWLWTKRVKPTLGWMGQRWDDFATGMKWVYDHTIKYVVDAFIALMGGPQGLKSKFQAVVDAISAAWSGLKKAFAAPIKFVVDTVINDGIIAGFNKIAHFVGSKEMGRIPLPKAIENAYATGGVLPGYFPGGDNHHFYSPTAGELHLSGGEAIMRPEFTRAVGGGWIQAMNQAAANGGAGAVKRFLNASAGHFFSDGGIFGGRRFALGGALLDPDRKVYMDGKAIAAIAAAQVLLAEKLRHVDYYLMQGGFGGDHIAASGTSHNYPGVADIARSTGVSFADQAALRRVAFAAWARNIPGAMYIGTGAHVHAASLLSPGTAHSPQVYGSWPGHTDGLAGGPDYGPRPPWLPDLADRLSQFDLSNIDAGGSGGHGFGLPGWLLDVAKNPLGWFTSKVTGPVHDLYDRFGESSFAQAIVGFPYHLAKDTIDRVLDIIPGGHKIAAAAGFVADKVGDAAHFVSSTTSHTIHDIADAGQAVGDFLGFSRGGILPYNGTMMYDAGGYLPPGLTSVVNLTGRPEPVFTPDQFERVSDGKGGFTYAPTFHDARGPEEIMDDLEFTMRKVAREGGDNRYGGAH